MMNNEFLIYPLDATLQSVASSFDCGSASIYNSFIKGSLALDPSFGKTFVLITKTREDIIGYYNIGAGDVEFNDGHQSLKCGGAIHINFLAVDKAYRGLLAFDTEDMKIYWSDILLNDCIQRIHHIREQHLGFAFITLTSSREGYNLYKRFNFERLDDDMYFSNTDEEKSGEGIDMYLPLDLEEDM